jgi:hypothetical protein
MSSKTAFATYTCTLLALLGWWAPKAAAIKHSGDKAVTTLTAVWTGSWEQPSGYIVKDAVTITLTETCVYRIAEWADTFVSLDDPSCKTNLAAHGAGSRTYPAPINSTVSWTYYAEQPRDPLTRLTLDPAAKTGQIDLDIPSSYVKSKSSDSKSSEGGAATMAIGMMITDLNPGVPHPGAQVSASPPFQDVFKFKFQPNARTISAGNHGIYRVSYTDRGGSAETGTFTLDYKISVGPAR